MLFSIAAICFLVAGAHAHGAVSQQNRVDGHGGWGQGALGWGVGIGHGLGYGAAGWGHGGAGWGHGAAGWGHAAPGWGHGALGWGNSWHGGWAGPAVSSANHIHHGGHGHGNWDHAWSNPSYKFSYSVSDPHTGDNKAQTEWRHGDVVKGAYSLVEPDGNLRTVNYAADDHRGFNAIVHHKTAHHHIAPLHHHHH